MADIDPPWRLDPLQTIVGVNWDTPGTPVSIWKWKPGTFVEGYPVDFWELVIRSDDGALDPAYKAAVAGLVAGGYSDIGDVYESLVTGLVVGPGFSGSSLLFVGFDAVSAAAADGHAEIPGDSRSFRAKVEFVSVFHLTQVFCRAWYQLGSSSM